MEIRKKYGILPSVGMRCSSEYERVPDGGENKVAVFEAYLEAGFQGIIPSLVAEVSLYFGFCPSQLTPLTWRTLMAIQVLGEFHGFSIGVHEVLYLYYFSPLASRPGFYHLHSHDSAPLVEEPSRGLKGNYPFGDDGTCDTCSLKSRGRSVILRYGILRVSSGILQWGGSCKAGNGNSSTFPRVAFLTSKEALCRSRVWGRPVILEFCLLRFRLLTFYLFRECREALGVCREYQKGKTRKRRPFYVPPPRLARTASRATSFSTSSSGDAEAPPNQDLEARVHRRLLGEVLFLRTQVQDMMAQRDLLIQRVRVFARWELMREWLEKRIDHWDP
ncbi:hypothetical protein Bca101_043800 [Brassica carinata]